MTNFSDLLEAIKKSPLTREMNEQDLKAVKKNYESASSEVLQAVIAKIESDTKLFEEKEKKAEEETKKLEDLAARGTELIKNQKIETEQKDRAKGMAKVESMLDQL